MFSPQARFSLRDPEDLPGRIDVQYVLYSSAADALYRLSELTKDEDGKFWFIEELGKLRLARVEKRKVNGVKMRVRRTEREKTENLCHDLKTLIRRLEEVNGVENE